MKKPYFWIAIFVLALNLFAFQNCGKIATSQIESASIVATNKADDSTQLMEKQIIVRMKDDASNAQLSQWANNNGLANMNSSDTSVMASWDAMKMSHWNWQGASTVAEVQAKLAEAGFADKIEFAEPNYMLNAPEDSVESFSGVTQLTGAQPYSSQLQDLSVNLTPIEPTSPRPIIAIIDSGANINHESFADVDAIWKNTNEIPNNGLDDDANGFVDDYNGYNFKDKNNNLTDQTGHGTHVAGIALGVGHNIFDLTQDSNMFPAQRAKVQLMILKFIGPTGGATSDAINAVFYAVNKGAKVLNNSWGGPNYSRALEDAILFAYDREVLFVAAAGNSATDNDTKTIYPANYNLPNVISVAASDNSDRLTSFSNFGLTTVDIAAPGSFILSTGDLGNTSFRTLSGTSMASPMVAGVAGLALYENRFLKAHQIKQIIIQQADSASTLSGRLKNSVRLNPNFAIAEAKIATPASTKPAFSRSLASSADAAEEAPKAGCGLVKIDTPNPPKGPPPMAMLALFMLPLLVAFRYKFST